MHALASRVTEDTAFHRDLTSHIWVLLDESDSKIQQADLLAMIAIAACGVDAAASTREHDALQLLRFTMEAKHTLERGLSSPQLQLVPDHISIAADPTTASIPHPAPEPHAQPEPQLASRNAPDVPSPKKNGTMTGQAQWRRRLGYVSIAACTLAVLCTLVALLYHRTRPEKSLGEESSAAGPLPTAGIAPRSGSERSAEPGTSAITVPPGSRNQVGVPVNAANHTVASAAASQALPPRLLPDEGQSAPAPSPASAGMLAGDGSTALPAGNLPAVVSSTAVTASRPRSGATAPVVVPSDILSKRLDSPIMPAYATGSDDAGEKRHPRLLRRRLPGSGADESGGDSPLTAVLRAPDLTASNSRSSVSGTAIRGVVRSTCLGMMASNLTYSPTPAYPAAALAAHMQGQVRIEATVDRDGTIGTARVVSGPPLLRDAALDAVKRWRYRPFVSGGKPSPTGTTAVVDFELQ